jgi:hypothetical protein
MERLGRSAFATLGAAAALGWALLFVQAPGVALELLLLTSPVVVTIWLIVALTGRESLHSRRRDAAPGSMPLPAAPEPAVECAGCGALHAAVPAVRLTDRCSVRRAARRVLPLCDRCAAESVLPTTPTP